MEPGEVKTPLKDQLAALSHVNRLKWERFSPVPNSSGGILT